VFSFCPKVLTNRVKYSLSNFYISAGFSTFPIPNPYMFFFPFVGDNSAFYGGLVYQQFRESGCRCLQGEVNKLGYDISIYSSGQKESGEFHVLIDKCVALGKNIDPYTPFQCHFLLK
jgi:hypothetical protein